ncbi:uncharacterized protein LOC143887157 [Tasmannia lanceolata]|uniref:uncharacterized protein LOC143887157 n=1 Tax=Tasmannia lanceolata TaxID=3420 RepID=UPI004063D2C2
MILTRVFRHFGITLDGEMTMTPTAPFDVPTFNRMALNEAAIDIDVHDGGGYEAEDQPAPAPQPSEDTSQFCTRQDLAHMQEAIERSMASQFQQLSTHVDSAISTRFHTMTSHFDDQWAAYYRYISSGQWGQAPGSSSHHPPPPSEQ